MAEITETNLESVNIDVMPKHEPKKKAPEPLTAEPHYMELSQMIPQTASLDQVSAKEYLQLNVFPKLEFALNNVSVHHRGMLFQLRPIRLL